MRLPFFKKLKPSCKELQQGLLEQRILVSLSDWCPACLEYKVVLNKLIADFPLQIEFVPPSELKLGVIPTTVFIKNEKMKRLDGFMTYERFVREYVDFFKEGNSVT